ncbi:MAG: BMP family ABC transporter substrate-binding protein [Fervidicoccaceae archaeon]
MSSGPRTSRRALIGAAGAAAVAGVLGYAVGRAAAPTRIVERTTTATVTRTATVTPPPRRVKAAWIYVGPIGDYGWTHAHELGRRYVEKRFPWLEARYKESVPEPEAFSAIKMFVEQGFDVVFTTSFGFMDATIEAGKAYPDKWFWHCSGYKRAANVGTYFAELYQVYYLNGFIAGAVTETRRLGYVPAFLIPEVIRHLNAFALGARDGARLAGKGDVKVYVSSELGAWFTPEQARLAAKILVDQYNVDVIAYTEDSPTVLQVAEEYQTKYNKRVWSFSHYSDMYQYGPNAHLTGQIVNWGPIYEYILAKYYAGASMSEDIWARLGDFEPVRWMKSPEKSAMGQPEGVVYLARVKTEVVPSNVLGAAKILYEQMKELLYEPFSGYDPVKKEPRDILDNEGRVRIARGERASHDDLWEMQWFLDNVERIG